MFVLADENRDKGSLFYGMGACTTAITTLWYDCAGVNSDTEGALYFWGHDGVAAYNVDPTWVDGPRMTCGSHT